MQHTPATIEEQLIAKAIREECPWETLPKRLQSSLTSKEDWHRKIIDFCIKKRLPWNACFARKVIREIEYYEEMMRYLRRNLALFPYHLSEYVCRVMRISPFKYYCDMIFEVMKNEQPYDSIPNFSAADALRITGIGRNEFIDIMNKCRSKKFMWKINKSIAKELLPTQPVDFAIETWWIVCLVNFTVEEYKRLTEEESAMIDRVLKLESKQYMEFDPRIIKGLYRRGLIYFDVPVNPDDRFKVSRLEGFVSNREQSYEDPIEELLYAVFVVASENATVAELAATLQADLSQLQAAASFACRLGWAVKMFDPAYILRDDDNPSLSDEEENIPGPAIPSNDEKIIRTDFSSSNARVSFIVDANITSYLMMGSVSPGLKSHAVTLYEAGKLGHASIADLCRDLSTLEGARFEGELQEFANHATSLRCVLQCLLSGGVSSEVWEVENSDKVDTSLEHSDHQKSAVVEPDISIHSASDETEPNNNEAISIPSISADFWGDNNVVAGNGEASSCMAKDSAEPNTGNVEENRVSGMIQNDVQDKRENATLGPDLQNDDKAVKVAGLEGGSKFSKRKRNYRVDVLRCESLATLAPATLERMFNREYGIILSMIPLPQNSMLPGPTGPVHLGPPCHAFMTPWMKLVLYSCARNGPLSVVLMKGQCLRLLPAPLAGCEKALVWSWDGSSIGGLGGKFEGTLVKGTVLLHCVNSLVKHSAALVQPLSKDDLDKSGNAVTIDIPLPLKNSDGSVVQVGEELGLDIVESSKLNSTLRDLAYKIDLWTIGYIRLLKLYIERDTDHFAPDDDRGKGTYEWVPLSVEFGVPLFSPKLCNQICKRVISSQLLQTESFAQHYEAMHNIRKMLRDICTECNWTGPTAKALYQKGKTKGSSRNLMNYASGRWNPLVEPSSPICGASSDPQRRKLALRQHSRREVLSFDGSILRSYALTPIFETATKSFEESIPGTSTTTAKADSDELDTKEVVFPGVNLLFDGSELHAFDICACLQARQLVSLVTEASAASSTYAVK